MEKKKKFKDVSALSKAFFVYDQTEGKDVPVQLGEGQREIFNTIVQRRHKYNHCMTYTRYGKSFVVAAAVLSRVLTHPEKWAIIAPSQPKAMIIMKYIIEFCNKNEAFKTMLEMEEGSKRGNRLLRETSKRRIVFRNGGEIFVLSADNRNVTAGGEALMGFGCPNIVLDESSLIDDVVYGKIVRMLGDHKDHFMFEIGNPFHRNHFWRDSRNDEFHHICVNYKQGLKEGRIEEKFIDKMRKEFDFGVMYEVKFPDEEDVDSDGWTILLNEGDIDNASRESDPNAYGEKRLGVDVARSGGNYNVWVLRTANHAEIIGRTTTDNLMEIVGTTRDFAKTHGVMDSNIFLDATGMGAGVYDRFREQNWSVAGINLAESALDKEKYINIRAEAYIRTREWLKAGGTLKKDARWLELCDIRYKTRSNGKIQIIDKLTLRKRNIKSPDVADALMLTFARPDETMSLYNIKKAQLKQSKQPTYE